MAGITGLGTTFNLPNYTGVLYGLSKEATPFLSAIGGLSNGGGGTADYEFEWQAYDLRRRGQNVALEGADAPTAQARVRANFSNLVQIHHEAVEVSYTKQAANQRLSGLNQGGTSNPVTDEMDFQVTQALKQIAGDVNWSFINGKYNKPADNTTARKTRGLLQAITTNTVVHSAAVSRTGGTSATDTITATHSLAVGQRVVFTAVSGAAADVINLGQAYYVQSISTTVSFKIAATSGGPAIT
ncbi:MAG: SU10 major capsid protein, partial [Pseudonocardiaceae bacterium]